MSPTAPADALRFDSFFEGGNLDLVVNQGEYEYDLYMRTDSNNRGHHQWFYFSVRNAAPVTAKFNILNFTKRDSLYEQGMRVAVFSERKAQLAAEGELPVLYRGWHRGGDNIVYRVSKLTQTLLQKAHVMYVYALLNLVDETITACRLNTRSSIRGTRCTSRMRSRTRLRS